MKIDDSELEEALEMMGALSDDVKPDPREVKGFTSNHLNEMGERISIITSTFYFFFVFLSFFRFLNYFCNNFGNC